jgi:Fe-S-cluster containining protein
MPSAKKTSAAPKPEWWREGVRFECQGSGKCCVSRGSYGYVFLNIFDRRRFAKHFKLSTQSFTKQYCIKIDGFWYLDDSKKNCRFLDGTRCSVYESRPTQCRTWPWWPENMKAKTWTKEIASFCPGVGKGRVWSGDEIQANLAFDALE